MLSQKIFQRKFETQSNGIETIEISFTLPVGQSRAPWRPGMRTKAKMNVEKADCNISPPVFWPFFSDFLTFCFDVRLTWRCVVCSGNTGARLGCTQQECQQIIRYVKKARNFEREESHVKTQHCCSTDNK